MNITVESPDGPRQGAEPYGGIKDEATLAKALLITLAVEITRGNENVQLGLSLAGLNPETFIVLARSLCLRKNEGSSVH